MKRPALQDFFLDALRKSNIPVAVYLVNGIKLRGSIKAFDQYSILLYSTSHQMVFKHAIATIVPTENVDWHAMIAHFEKYRAMKDVFAEEES